MTEVNESYKRTLFQNEVARGIRELHELGFLPNEQFGDVSVRDAQTGNIYISVQPGTFHVVTPGEYHGCDIAICDASGNPLTHDTLPSDALPMHLALYRAREDIQAIVHVQAHWCASYALKRQELPFVLEEQCELGGTIRCVSHRPEESPEYYAQVVEKMQDRMAVMLYQNGIITAAGNVDRAINYVAWLESIVRKVSYASLIGTVRVLSD